MRRETSASQTIRGGPAIAEPPRKAAVAPFGRDGKQLESKPHSEANVPRELEQKGFTVLAVDGERAISRVHGTYCIVHQGLNVVRPGRSYAAYANSPSDT